MYKALIVDDHPVIRATMRLILEREKFKVVAEADNGTDAVQMAHQYAPDLILLDLSMPKMDGFEVMDRLAGMKLSSKTLVMTSQPPEFYAARCMKAGAAGYVSKTDEIEHVVKAVSAIMLGYTFFPDLASVTVRKNDGRASELKLIQKLSNRELETLQQLALGWNNKEIGDKMLLSNKTVSTYKARLMEKLGLKSLVHLSDFAKRNDLI